ncbi:MAG: hypothetical protein GXY74_16290 [Phycisphaerae bacterium]|jgi:hypothetical protein|nr:hypothetical protein [Phycisphaerae bacterium]
MGDHSLGRDARCVVCGRRLTSDHKCPKSVLRAREAAERRAANIDDPLHPAIPHHMDDRRRLIGDRLSGWA